MVQHESFIIIFYGLFSRFSLRQSGSSSPPINPVEQIDPQPGALHDYSMDLEDDFDEVSDRGLGAGGWRHSRFSRMTRRNLIPSRSNWLLHPRSLNIHRRKPSLLSRIFHGRTLQSQMRSVTNHSPMRMSETTTTLPPVNQETVHQRSGDQVPDFLYV